MKRSTLTVAKYIAVILFAAVVLDIFIQHQLFQRYRNDQILSVHLQAATIRARLEKQISSNLYIVQGLANYISLNPDLSAGNFDQYSREVLYSSKMIRAIGAAPDYVVRYVYPLRGNEGVVGLDYRKVPEQWEQCRLAEKTGRMIVAGPVNLVQGGRAFIGRVPVFVRNELREAFWGVVSAVIDEDLLLGKAGVKSERNIRLAIRGVDGKGADGEIFFGDPEIFNPEMKAILMPVSLSSGSWQLAAMPMAGWDNIPPNSYLIHFFMFLLVLGISLAAVKIISKNVEVEQVKTKLSEAQTIAHLGNWSLELQSGKIWWSNETYRIFGVSKESFSPSEKGFLRLVHPEDRRFIGNIYMEARKDCSAYNIDHRIIRPDGKVRYISEQGRFDCDENGIAVRAYGTILDITERKLIEKELLEAKTRFDHVTKKLSSKFIFFAHTICGEFVNLSEGFEMLGYGPLEKGLGRRWTDVIDIQPDSLAVALENNEKVISGELDTVEYEIAYLSPEGRERFLAVFGYMTFDYNRDEYLFEGVAIDITERKEREEKLKVLTRAIENAPVSVVITDTAGTIRYVNPHFSYETGYSKEEAIGANPRILKSGEHDNRFYREMWETITSGETWRGEIANRKKDGSLYWESASISAVYNGKGQIVSYVAVKEDIDAKKALEQLKNDVDLIMRHDLKTPLNGIIGLPGLLSMDDNLTDNQLHLLKVIEDSGKNMLHMIDMSLDMFKMETGKYVYTPQQIDAVYVARQVVVQCGSTISARKVNVDISVNGEKATEDSSFLVWGEERLMYSLFSGLLTNAIEASPVNGIVSVSFADSDHVSVSFSNKGAVPARIRERFFQKYVTEGKSNGTGLGTYSAKLMADTMNYGIIMETSDQSDTTCITISIPHNLE
ncbi:PAS domain S-box protein [Maridesulfovibrio sp. FT414]|uniref:PAS domain S-box protein n=1 Tax=Maridesulfovibrio sp. FT414 TaxID=2979469 RepID=UPI003D803363